MQVEISSQCLVDTNKPIRMGEVLTDTLHRGKIGWIDWCHEVGSRPHVPTARLEIVGSRFGIFVAEDYRIPSLDIGEELIEQMSYRLRSLGYVDLVVLGAINQALPFYYHAFNSLITTNVATYYSPINSPGRNTKDNHDFRVIYRPKPVFLPG